jgi:colanic acid biosynthesis protein WcaH
MFIPDNIYQTILGYLPILCVDVLIVHDKKCLLLLRDNEPAKGTYWFPGGRVNKDETIAKASVRKAKEETNLDCTFRQIISTEESIFEKTGEMSMGVHTVNVCCLMSVSEISRLKPDHLHKDALWVDYIDKHWHPAVINPLTILGFDPRP